MNPTTMLSMAASPGHICNCIGPSPGEPLCPCMMAGVKVVDGRYVKTQDLGVVPDWKKDSPIGNPPGFKRIDFQDFYNNTTAAPPPLKTVTTIP